MPCLLVLSYWASPLTTLLFINLLTGNPMTTTKQKILEIETAWWKLVELRQEHYNHVLSEVAKEQRLAVIEELNQNMEYEQLFDQMEGWLRKLDPNHSYLAENQINIY